MPPARWPRLRGGVSSSLDPLPWDVLEALALIDGLAGDGGEFWQRYCDVMLPGPEQLTLPMCWEAPRLAQLQHADIASAATAQQASASGSGEAFELVALRDIAPGEEVTICYSGPEGYTNQRFMAQYGFVPRGGNPADRVKFELQPEHEAAPLDLARLQDLMGDALFLSALRRSDPYLHAGLKSLPLVDRSEDTAQQAAAGSGAGGAAGGDASVRTAAALLRQLELQMAESTTSMEFDQELLEGPGSAELLAADPRQAAAVSYRLERKRLLSKTAALLRAYSRGMPAAVTVFNLTGQPVHQNPASIEYFGVRVRCDAHADAAAGGSGNLLEQLFALDPGKMERMLADVLREGGGNWKGAYANSSLAGKSSYGTASHNTHGSGPYLGRPSAAGYSAPYNADASSRPFAASARGSVAAGTGALTSNPTEDASGALFGRPSLLGSTGSRAAVHVGQFSPNILASGNWDSAYNPLATSTFSLAVSRPDGLPVAALPAAALASVTTSTCNVATSSLANAHHAHIVSSATIHGFGAGGGGGGGAAAAAGALGSTSGNLLPAGGGAVAAPDAEERWHEVWATRAVDPVTGCPVIILAQRDVTAKVVAERHLALVMEAEHRLLAQLFPKHILSHVTEEWIAEVEGAPAPAALSAGHSGRRIAGGGNKRWRPVVRDCNALATWHPQVTLLFADIVGFTPMCKQVGPRAVMEMLNDLFSRFDAMLDLYGVFKVETIGDCYFVAAGLVQEDEDGMAAVCDGRSRGDPLHARRVFGFAKVGTLPRNAQSMLAAAREVRMPSNNEAVKIRIGISSGPVLSGVVGTRMPRWCLFGDTVSTTSRMENTGVPGAVHASASAHALLGGEAWQPTDGVYIKGKGLTPTYLWTPPEAASDGH
ncbi:hypothetical protein GPECTOR_2g1352 [Gonium pectorale]|uniref:Guanylate cyclase domain-containing protein n=1 Tax=Gonium pectorale TaxID=33097 RepID=A0A150H1F0_GONPE|nr:hypothetical protein GPECTOR_2g1352 [Gonium pectorale]|eukprot:KXZ55802.1 hypothetical protein GPECTOR_2g1352 [Gonium pectorale]